MNNNSNSSAFVFNRGSSILHSYIDTSSLLIINSRSKIQPNAIDRADYYTLIDKIAFVKKTADKLKVTTPAGSS